MKSHSTVNSIQPSGSIHKTLGLDACQGEWAVCWVDSAGGFDFEKHKTIADLFPAHDDAAAILIDIPIGLAENPHDRRPDAELRARLKGKSSSVFETPCRQAVYASTRDSARELNLKTLNKSLSCQSIGFSKKIREVDEFLLTHPRYIDRLRESHPEYAFCLMNGGQPLLSRKIEPAGLNDRLAVLARHFPAARQCLSSLRARNIPDSTYHDFLDAMVLAVMGLMGARRGFETIPPVPLRDRRGLRMEIAYCRPER